MIFAPVAELVDAQGSEPCGFAVEVRILSGACIKKSKVKI